MSEIALGWCTYNADHMSMYGVNSGVPKTLVRWVIQTAAENEAFSSSRECLQSILTHRSALSCCRRMKREISSSRQRMSSGRTRCTTSSSTMRFASDIRRKGVRAVLHCVSGRFQLRNHPQMAENFYRRFWTQQFKRNCMPDGVKIGSIALSPRGDWRMPSDAQYKAWMDECDCIKA